MSPVATKSASKADEIKPAALKMTGDDSQTRSQTSGSKLTAAKTTHSRSRARSLKKTIVSQDLGAVADELLAAADAERPHRV